MNRIYDIFLDNIKIGTTRLEKGDAPMGIAFGAIDSFNSILNYEFIKQYCMDRKIEVTSDCPEDKLIATSVIPNLKVINLKGEEIIGQGNSISGMDSDEYEITILGIPYPYYEEQFPEHVEEYQNRFK